MLARPPAIWASGWINVPASAKGADDFAHWQYFVSVLGGLLSWALFTGLLVVLILGLVVSPICSLCSWCYSLQA